MEGASGVLHPSNRCHSDMIGQEGLETFSIQFDPVWLRADVPRRLNRSIVWSGGNVAAKASRLIAAWEQKHPHEDQLKVATLDFLSDALSTAPLSVPKWLRTLRAEVRSGRGPRTTKLARALGLHPAYLARCYRHAFGEGLTDTRRRCRVEEAVGHLRTTNQPLAEVAVASGFSDESHMTRNFSQLLGRTPLQIRQERKLLGM
jgi:AraC family transcriptional regulator